MERGAWPINMGHGPKLSAMILNNRAANRQAHAKSRGLGAEKGIEDPIRHRGRNTGTSVAHRDHNLTRLIFVGSHQQRAGTSDDTLHRLDAIHDQIDKHLLKLNQIRVDHTFCRRASPSRVQCAAHFAFGFGETGFAAAQGALSGLLVFDIETDADFRR